MKVLVDTDILLKLGTCDLLDQLPGLLGVERRNFLVLPQARFMIRNHRATNNSRYTVAGCEQALSFLESVDILEDEALDLGEIGRFIQNEGIDVGEATLFVAAQQYDDSLILTGDKRSLEVLASSGDLADAWNGLKGRVLCLEQVVLLLMEEVGFEPVCESVSPVCNCDTVLSIAFSQGSQTDPEHAREALLSYTPDHLKP